MVFNFLGKLLSKTDCIPHLLLESCCAVVLPVKPKLQNVDVSPTHERLIPTVKFLRVVKLLILHEEIVTVDAVCFVEQSQVFGEEYGALQRDIENLMRVPAKTVRLL